MASDANRVHEYRGPWRAGGVGLVLKVGSVALSLATTVLLARILGPDGYGTYAFVLAVVMLVGIPAQAGLPTLVVRETANAYARQAWSEMAGLWRWTTKISGALALAVLAATVVLIAAGLNLAPTLATTLIAGLALIPLMALSNLRGAAIRGLHRVVLGQLPELIIRPAVLLLLLGGLMLFARDHFTPATAMVVHVIAAALAFLVGSAMLNRITSINRIDTKRRVYRSREWLSSTGPLALIAGMHVVNANTDIVMLGLFATHVEVGLYRVAVQAASLVAFGLQAVNMVIAPRMASLYATGEMRDLQRVATDSARMAIAFALPAALVLAVFGTPVLAFLFGEGFGGGGTVLALLALAQLVNAVFGSVGMLLNMTGNERDTAKGVAVATAANVVLNLVLIPSYGMLGAAFATITSFAIWNGLLWRAALNRLGISTTPFPRSQP